MAIDELKMLLSPFDTNCDSMGLQTRFGLGMILCRSMCQKCGGDLMITSFPNGNIYTFYFPLQVERRSLNYIAVEKENGDNGKEELKIEECEKQNEIAIPQKETNQEHSVLEIEIKNGSDVVISKNSQLTILLVDDTPFNNVVLKKLLDKFAIETLMCSNGLEAVEQVKETVFGMIFMDINMPVMDGIEATRQIKAYLKSLNMNEIPIVGISSQSNSVIIEQAMSAGMDEYGISII